MKTGPRRKYLIIPVVVITGIIISFILFFMSKRLENRRLIADFELLADARSDAIQLSLQDHIFELYSLQSFFDASQSVNRQEFSTFVSVILPRHVGVISFDWVPRISDSNRGKFEEAIQKEGVGGFKIRDLGNEGKLSEAKPRPEYFPIYYSVPPESNPDILGFNLMSSEVRWQAMLKAVNDDAPIATPRIRSIRRGSDYACRLFLPVYRNGVIYNTKELRQQNLLGYISTLFLIKDTIDEALKGMKQAGIDVCLYDESAPSDDKLLYCHIENASLGNRKQGSNRGFIARSTFDFGGRKWRIVATPTEEFFAVRKFAGPWFVLFGSFILTFFLASYLFSILNRSAEIERLIEERTAELIKAKDKATLLYKVSPSAIFTVDKEMRIVSWNNKATEITGYTNEEVMGKQCFMFAEYPCKDKCGLYSDDASKPIIGQECTIKRKDGTMRIVTKNADFLKDEFGNVMGGIESFEDITERKLAENAIRIAFDMTHSILEKAPFGIFVVNKTGNIDYVNTRMIEISGSTYEQFKGMNILEVPTYKELGLDQKIRDVINSGESFFMGDVDYTSFYSKKKSIRNFTGMSFEEEGQRKALIFVEDVTAEKQAEQKLEEAAEEWKRTFDSISDMIFIQDIDSTILRANKAFLESIKSPAKDVIGKKCYQVMHNLDHPWPECPFEKTKQDKLTHTEEVHDKNIGIPLLVSTSPIFDNKGNLIGSVHISKDISDIIRAREELEKKNEELRKLDQLKSDFVSTVSHELRTPLSITKEGISLIIDGIPGAINEKQRKILSTAKDNVDRLARIINELLDISRIEAGKIEIRRESTSLNHIIETVITSFSLKTQEKNLELKLTMPERPVEIYIDPDKMIQVFTNFVDNAIKFTEKGAIEVSCIEKENEVECCVRDSGVGISAEDLPKLFDKFQQFGRTPGPGEKGTGLGLSIAKGIIDLHKGRIWVESEFGKGTKFYFSLPKYTYETLTKEYIDSGIDDSLKNHTKFSYIIVTAIDFNKISGEIEKNKLHEVLRDIEAAIRNSLRRSKDTTLKGEKEFGVFLYDCNRENALRVEGRIEQVIEDCLITHSLSGRLQFKFGCVTFPDQASNYEELSNIIRKE